MPSSSSSVFSTNVSSSSSCPTFLSIINLPSNYRKKIIFRKTSILPYLRGHRFLGYVEASDVVAYILTGPPSKYDSLVAVVTTLIETVTVDALYGFLLSHELRLEQQTATAELGQPTANLANRTTSNSGRGGSRPPFFNTPMVDALKAGGVVKETLLYPLSMPAISKAPVLSATFVSRLNILPPTVGIVLNKIISLNPLRKLTPLQLQQLMTPLGIPTLEQTTTSPRT
ncbi:hypothetical protein AAC387_Pa06g2254 [Persea americana]